MKFQQISANSTKLRNRNKWYSTSHENESRKKFHILEKQWELRIIKQAMGGMYSL